MAGHPGLDGAPIVITGAGSGIGRATALRLADEGAHVAILDRNAEAGTSVAETITSKGGSAHAFAVDITDEGAVEAALSHFEATEGAVVGLVNNAGWDVARSFLETDLALWRKVIEINLVGPLIVTKAVLSRMQPRGRGRIVSIASDAARVGSSIDRQAVRTMRNSLRNSRQESRTDTQ